VHVPTLALAVVACGVAWLLLYFGSSALALALVTALAIGLAARRPALTSSSDLLRATARALMRSLERERQVHRWCAELMEAIAIAAVDTEASTNPSAKAVERARSTALMLGEQIELLLATRREPEGETVLTESQAEELERLRVKMGFAVEAGDAGEEVDRG
jgi:hypothetical protein